jgi:hypothetical protein
LKVRFLVSYPNWKWCCGMAASTTQSASQHKICCNCEEMLR